jgi:hypothetical protein
MVVFDDQFIVFEYKRQKLKQIENFWWFVLGYF